MKKFISRIPPELYKPFVLFLFFILMALVVNFRYFEEYLTRIPRSMRPVKWLLDTLLVDHIGHDWSVFALVAIGIFSICYGIRRYRKRKQRNSPAERDQLLFETIEGVARQVHHEHKLIADSLSSFPKLLLVPAPSMDINATMDGWLGGSPRLPDDIRLSASDDTVFLAQINCSCIPAELWGGLGPRSGYLVFFVSLDESFHHHPKVLHVDEFGSPRVGPDIHNSDWHLHSMGDHIQFPPGLKPGEICFPLESRVINCVDELPNLESPHLNCLRKGFSLNQPEMQPFDWPTTLSLLQHAISHVESELLKIPEQIDRLVIEQQDIRDKASEDENTIEQGRQRQLDIDQEIAALKSIQLDHENVKVQLELIYEKTVSESQASEFSVDGIAHLISSLGEIEISQLVYEREPERWVHAKTVRFVKLPTTDHYLVNKSNKGNYWLAKYERYRYKAIKDVYERDPDAISDQIKQYAEQSWNAALYRESVNIQNFPVGYVYDFDSESEVVLLELPTSRLLQWKWGDMYNLVFIIDKDDLNNGNYENVRTFISN